MGIRLGFLASHNGTNMQAILDACKSGFLEARPKVVISNNSKSGALTRAKKEGIPGYHLSGNTHCNPADIDYAILETLNRHDVNLVILVGYMKKLGAYT